MPSVKHIRRFTKNGRTTHYSPKRGYACPRCGTTFMGRVCPKCGRPRGGK